MTNKTTSRWSAVSIVAGNNSCEAAHALKGQRLLSTEAPRLPLAGCAAAQTAASTGNMRTGAQGRAAPRSRAASDARPAAGRSAAPGAAGAARTRNAAAVAIYEA